jgi:large subunit ribosomal protein L18
MATQEKVRSRARRHRRVRKKIVGTPDRPRLAVYRSNRHIYAQIIDDVSGRTLASASTLAVTDGEDPIARARSVGKALGEKAKGTGIDKVAFDRGGFRYHGRVRAVAEGARERGLEL